MATPKKTAKAAPKNKKTAPKKVVPAKKVVKAIAKKVVAKAPVKKAKNAITKSKSIVKKVVKPVAKPVAKAVVAKGKAVVVNKTVKPVAKVIPAKVVAPTPTHAAKPAPKKIELIKPTAPIKPAASGTMMKANAKNAKDIKVLAPKSVTIPKISTKTSRQYQPDFTKSVLDQPKINLGASIVRYNDSDLLEFRELIQRKLEAAKKELNYLQGLITRKDEMGGDESENRYMTMEDGSLSMQREQLSQMASRQITFIDHLEKALMLIENKTYGICRVTGKLIEKARLRDLPHATLSMEAKMTMPK